MDSYGNTVIHGRRTDDSGIGMLFLGILVTRQNATGSMPSPSTEIKQPDLELQSSRTLNFILRHRARRRKLRLSEPCWEGA